MAEDEGEALFARGVALQQALRFAEAAELYRELARTRLTSNLACNLGACLAELGDWEGATHFLELAAQHRPQDADFRRRLAAVHGEVGRLELAEEQYRAALALAPGDKATELGLAALYLSAGRYAEGWPLFAARVALNPGMVPRVAASFPEWRGEPLGGKSILVWVEQGFGDQIQMSRCANSLKAAGASRVSLGCRPQLADLFATLAGADTIIPVAA
ncbi:MAG TPA: hypothetical protein VIE16_02810, partial [Phenylobacterium sp.]